MAKLKPQKRLKKELSLLSVYAIATGSTLSAGFFLLPGIAATQAGPAIVVAYLLAAIPMIPAMFSVIELATAMPRAGGVYYFLDRALGPLMGTIGGLGTWLALILKVAFALVGLGAYTALFLPNLNTCPIAVGIAIVLGGLNWVGARKSGGLQIFLVFALLSIMAVFLSSGTVAFRPDHFEHLFAAGFDSLIATTGMVYISYVGVTKVASLSEEVKDPEKNLPKGVILAMTTAILIYGAGTMMIVGLVPMKALQGNLTPLATAAQVSLGSFGKVLLSIAAILAFISVANAGSMSASRYPLAMSRDHLLPRVFRKLGRFGTPSYAIILTTTVIILILVLFDPTRIAKLASTFQLLMFALVCLAVIVMRESQIQSYDPGYRSPLYPWMQIVGVVLPFYLIYKMGIVPMLFSICLILLGVLWYFCYARHRVRRSGAIYHVFERLGRHRHHDLDTELRSILREKGLREEDPFDEIVARSMVFDFEGKVSFEGVVKAIACKIEPIIHLPPETTIQQIMEGTRVGATPVMRGVALPHFRTNRIEQSEMVLVRSLPGIDMTLANPFTLETEEATAIQAIFFLVSPESNPSQHLRILARIAERVDEDSFAVEWAAAKDKQELRETLLRDEHFLTIVVKPDTPTAIMAGRSLENLKMPSGCLVAMLFRSGKSSVPNGRTVLREGDRLTVVGDEKGLDVLKSTYGFK